MSDLWVEKYRPKKLSDYVFKNDLTKQQIYNIVQNSNNVDVPLPNLGLYGIAGTGKTSLALTLCKELNIHENDILVINGSRENNVETVREKITNFCYSCPFGNYKVVILDEFDGFGLSAQKILRGLIEQVCDSVRFIVTGNYANKIIPAMHSRFQELFFDSIDKNAFIDRILYILECENVQYDIDILSTYIKKIFPDMRKCINELQWYTVNNVLTECNDNINVSDYLIDAANLFKNKKIYEARKLIISQATVEQYIDIYRFLYENLHIWSDDITIQDAILIVIAKGLVNHSLVADVEINLSATLAEITNLVK